MDVYQFFAYMLGEEPHDESLQEMDIDTPCGRECVKAINAASAFLDVVDRAVRPTVLEAVNQAVEILVHG